MCNSNATFPGRGRVDRGAAAASADGRPATLNTTSGSRSPDVRTQPNRRPAVVRCAFCGRLNRVDLDRLAAGPKCAGARRPIPLDQPLQVTDADFDAVVAGASVPVLVDFYADWCGPCRMMAPTLDSLPATAPGGDVLVLKLDTEANPRRPPASASAAFRRSSHFEAAGAPPARRTSATSRVLSALVA